MKVRCVGSVLPVVVVLCLQVVVVGSAAGMAILHSDWRQIGSSGGVPGPAWNFFETPLEHHTDLSFSKNIAYHDTISDTLNYAQGSVDFSGTVTPERFAGSGEVAGLLHTRPPEIRGSSESEIYHMIEFELLTSHTYDLGARVLSEGASSHSLLLMSYATYEHVFEVGARETLKQTGVLEPGMYMFFASAVVGLSKPSSSGSTSYDFDLSLRSVTGVPEASPTWMLLSCAVIGLACLARRNAFI